MMIAAPLFHSWGFFHFVMSLPTASTMVLRRRFDPEGTLRAVQEHRAQVLAVVPVMLQRILQLPEETLASYDLSSLRITSVSGSALPGELAIEWMDRFGDNVYNLYGSTEVAYATVATPEDLRAAPGTAGRPPRGTVVRLYDEDGREVPTGEVGRIFVGNEMSFEGYTGGGGKEAIDGLLCSGDVGHFDADGRLFIDGRDDEMIVSGGENVFPREVEDLLADHEAVVEVGRDRGRGRGVRPAAEGVRRRRRPRPRSAKKSWGPHQGQPRLLQGAARGRVPRRAAAQRDRQDPQARAARRDEAAEVGLEASRGPPANCGIWGRRGGVASAPVVGCAIMGEPAVQLKAVGEATEELHETSPSRRSSGCGSARSASPAAEARAERGPAPRVKAAGDGDAAQDR